MRWRPTSPTQRRPATAASTWTSTARWPRRSALPTPRPRVAGTTFTTQTDQTVGVTQADGNSIDIDNESAKLSANALESEAAITVAKARIAILKSAMGVG